MGMLSDIKNKVPGVLLLFSIFFLTSCSTQTTSGNGTTNSTKKSESSISQEVNSQFPEAPTKITGELPQQSCEDIITIKELYDYNPNFALDPSAKTPLEETSKKFTSVNGVTCVYKNLSSSTTIQLSVAKISTESINHQKKLLADSQQNILPGTSATKISTFEIIEGIGIYQTIQGNHWVSVTSSIFQTYTDVELFVAPLLGRL